MGIFTNKETNLTDLRLWSFQLWWFFRSSLHIRSAAWLDQVSVPLGRYVATDLFQNVDKTRIYAFSSTLRCCLPKTVANPFHVFRHSKSSIKLYDKKQKQKTKLCDPTLDDQYKLYFLAPRSERSHSLARDSLASALIPLGHVRARNHPATDSWKNVFYHHGHTRPINLDKRHSSLAQLRLSFEAELGYSIPFKDDSNRLDLIYSTKVSCNDYTKNYRTTQKRESYGKFVITKLSPNNQTVNGKVPLTRKKSRKAKPHKARYRRMPLSGEKFTRPLGPNSLIANQIQTGTAILAANIRSQTRIFPKRRAKTNPLQHRETSLSPRTLQARNAAYERITNLQHRETSQTPEDSFFDEISFLDKNTFLEDQTVIRTNIFSKHILREDSKR
ncbi:hypothetical protein YC2023_084624 [Brassica napus]